MWYIQTYISFGSCLQHFPLKLPTDESIRASSSVISTVSSLSHWGRVMHIFFSNLTIIGSDNGLLPGRRQAIIWTNAGILLIGPLGTNFGGILFTIHTFSFQKKGLKMSSGKWPSFCLGLNVLICHYNLVNLLQNTHGSPMMYLSWVQNLISILL